MSKIIKTGIRAIDKTWGDDNFINPGITSIISNSQNSINLALQMSKNISTLYEESQIYLFDVMDKYDENFINSVIGQNDNVTTYHIFDNVSFNIYKKLMIIDACRNNKYKDKAVFFVMNISEIIRVITLENKTMEEAYHEINLLLNVFKRYNKDFKSNNIFFIVCNDIGYSKSYSNNPPKMKILPDGEYIQGGNIPTSLSSSIIILRETDNNIYSIEMILKELDKTKKEYMEFNGQKF